MPRARIALLGAGACLVLLVATWYAAFHVGLFERADRSILRGFAELHRPRIDSVTSFIAHLCSPKRYVFLAAVPVVVALLRRRLGLAMTVALIILCANVTTQLLKAVVATPRHFELPGFVLDSSSWPSGHATAAMALALCAVLVAPTRLRPAVGAVMAAFAVAVCYSFLELGWHYPSDVLGGFEVATMWTLLGTGALAWLHGRHPTPRPVTDGRVSVTQVLAPVGLVIAAGLVAVGAVVAVRPHEVITYAGAHGAFVAGAAVIAAVGLAIATGLTLALRR